MEALLLLGTSYIEIANASFRANSDGTTSVPLRLVIQHVDWSVSHQLSASCEADMSIDNLLTIDLRRKTFSARSPSHSDQNKVTLQT